MFFSVQIHFEVILFLLLNDKMEVVFYKVDF